MTPERINQVIAESLDAVRTYVMDGVRCFDTDHYHGDLNSCALFEDRVSNSKDGKVYGEHLVRIVLGFGPTAPDLLTLNFWSLMLVAKASAPQRCEAYLRTVNLWEE